MSNLTIYVDYGCPYVHRAIEMIATLQQAHADVPPVTWRFFSLAQVNHRLRDGWQVWDLPTSTPDWETHDAARALRFFWAAEAARRQGDDALLRFQLVLARTIHVERTPVDSWDAVDAVAEKAGLDLPRYAADRRDPAALQRLATDHQSGVELSVFGTPTFVFADAAPAYLKLARVLDADAAPTTWAAFRAVAQARAEILEIKRPQ